MKKIKNDKFIFLLFLVGLISFVILKEIIAFLSDVDEKFDKMKIGLPKMVILESDWNEVGYSKKSNIEDTIETDEVDIGLGHQVPKIQNTGTYPLYVYVEVEVPKSDYSYDLKDIISGDLVECRVNEDYWTELSDSRCTSEKNNIYVYYYNSILSVSTGEIVSTTMPIFDELKLNDNIEQIGEEISGVKIKAYGVRANNSFEESNIENTDLALKFKNNAIEKMYLYDEINYMSLEECDTLVASSQMDVGETQNVEIIIPEVVDKTLELVTYCSSDENVAIINEEGMITAVGSGLVNISITGTKSAITKNIELTVIGNVLLSDCEVSVENEIMLPEDIQQIIITKPVGILDDVETLLYSSSDESVAIVDDDGVITALSGGTITITVLGSKSGIVKTINITVVVQTRLGQYVNLGTNLLGELSDLTFQDDSHPLAEWRVFDIDENGTWLILASYLSFSDVPSNIGIKQKVAPYSVTYSANRTGMLNGLSNTTAWKEIISANNNLYANENVIVKGTPTIQEWLESWHSNAGYVHINVAMKENYGYYVYKDGESASSNKTSLSSNNGYNDTLYFPYKTNLSRCNGYFLNSPNASSTSAICGVNSSGQIAYNYANNNGYLGLRPIVYIPSSISFDQSQIVWTIAN